MHYKGADQLLAVKALNEFDPKCVTLSLHVTLFLQQQASAGMLFHLAHQRWQL